MLTKVQQLATYSVSSKSVSDDTSLEFLSLMAEVDMLENIEIGEQKRRDEAYKASKNKTGVYDDK